MRRAGQKPGRVPRPDCGHVAIRKENVFGGVPRATEVWRYDASLSASCLPFLLWQDEQQPVVRTKLTTADTPRLSRGPGCHHLHMRVCVRACVSGWV